MENRKSILDLNDYCMLEILKYIIADCKLRYESQSDIMNYLDLVNFALAHEGLEAVLRQYDNDLYKYLEFLLVANKRALEIDFAQLQSTYTGKAGDKFWRFFADAIRENSKVNLIKLLYSPQSFQPDFLDKFQMIKRALEKKMSLGWLMIDLTGYSLDDLDNFGHIKDLNLNVRVNAEALATICKSNPYLRRLNIMTTDILGRLSDIVPHCRNLEWLAYMPKPDVDIAEYAPLAQLPNLRVMAINGAFKNGFVLTMFEARRKWQNPGNAFLDIVFADELPELSSVTLPRKNLLRSLDTSKDISPTSVYLTASYNFLELTADIDQTEEFHATFTVIGGVNFFVNIKGIRMLKLFRYKASMASELASRIKALNVDILHLHCSEENSQAELVKLFRLLHPEGSFALIRLQINGQELDQFGTSELATFTDWESFEHLSNLINLRDIRITVNKQLGERFLQALCNSINNCHRNLYGHIKCTRNTLNIIIVKKEIAN